MEEKILEFADQKGIPSGEEMDNMANEWEKYIQKYDLARSLECKKDFLMGMILMGRRWNNQK